MPQSQNEIVTGLVVTITFFIFAGFIIILLVAHMNQRKKWHIHEKKVMQSSFEEELLRTRLEIQEQTFRNISQEIHDNIGQVLSLAKLNLATTEIDSSHPSRQKVEDSKNLVA